MARIFLGNARPICALLASLWLIASCSTQDAYVPPIFQFGSKYHANERASRLEVPVLLQNDDWWTRFNDPVLNRIVETTLSSSLSLELARARVVEARAGLAGVPGAAVFQSELGMAISGAKGVKASVSAPTALGLSWMLDPYGDRRAEVLTANARLDMSEAEVQAAQLLLIYNVLNSYIELRYLQRILVLREQEAEGRRETLKMVQGLQQAESTTELEVTRSKARLAEIEAMLPSMRADATAKINEIAVLAGIAPGNLAIDLKTERRQPLPDLAPEVGIPADLLRNRPDIRIAEREYYIAVSELSRDKAGVFPKLSLTGAITLTARESGRLSQEFRVGPNIQFPTLPGKPARARIEAGNARVVQAGVRWKSTVLSAILEVENGLLDYRASSEASNYSRRAVNLYRDALDLSREVFDSGGETLGDLIDAQQDLVNAEQAEAEMVFRQGISFVALNVRLGAGQSATAETGR